MDGRKRDILRAVVDRYIERAEPVGSKTLSENRDLSPATLRNEMAALEEMGYLEHPHTSAGRVPTPKGYRFYVDELMESYRLSVREMQEINKAMRERLRLLDDMLDSSAELLSRLTRLASVTLGPAYPASAARIKRLEAFMPDPGSAVLVAALETGSVKTATMRIPESLRPVAEEELRELARAMPDGAYAGRLAPLLPFVKGFCAGLLAEDSEVCVHGEANLLDCPEYRDIRRAGLLLRYLSEERRSLASALRASPGVTVLIGAEGGAGPPANASVVAVSYEIGGGAMGVVGVVGPTRMDYARLCSRLSYFAEQISKRLKE
ncbi:MAG: heat-inducible transcriptional repressor HrcA [Oscillospiraceae bacterium]|jgi:heat-inducible transcriptional repressor|nr:heat-inducible transcriptional repressor HrcA [Oscillospiraceae bacterium]